VKVALAAKLGTQPTRAEPSVSRRRGLRVVDPAPALEPALETPAAAFRLSRTPIEAPERAPPSDEPLSVAPHTEIDAAAASREPSAVEAAPDLAPRGARPPSTLRTEPPSELAPALITPVVTPVATEPVVPLHAVDMLAMPLAGTTAEIAPRLNALSPSLQADRYAELGPALDAALGARSVAVSQARPELRAALPGALAPAPTPVIEAPREIDSTSEPSFDRTEPVFRAPRAPDRAVIERAPVPSGLPQSGVLANLTSLRQAFGAAASRPEIPTHIESPAIPLEGAADPHQLDSVQAAATSDARTALQRAQAPVQAVSPELLQPLALDQTVSAAPLPELAPLAATPTIEGMDQFAAYALSETDRAAFDARMSGEMHAACASADAELARNETEHDLAQRAAFANADTEGAAARARAELERQSQVQEARQDLTLEQGRVLDEQRAAADGQLGELAQERSASADRIDQQLDSDRAAIDATYAQGQHEAEEQIARGASDAETTRADASKRAEAESWWDWGIDTWQATVRSFADHVVSIWEAVAEGVRALLDRVIAQATRLVEGALRFVKQVLSEYFAFWQHLIQELLGSIFPELAAALTSYIDELTARVFGALDAIAALYLGALRLVADTLVGALYAGLEAYKAGVAAYLAVWEAIQQGQWAELGTLLLSALLLAAGIDPAEFFATFGKLDDVLEALAANPGVVVTNALAALKLGFDQFGANFLGHFAAAAVEWLTGASGVQLPATFDLAGLFDVVRQVLGLTNEDLRRKAVKYLGETAVTAAEELYQAILELVRGGWGGLWTHIKDELTTLVDDVVIVMGTWLVEKAILVVGRWIVGLIATAGLSAIVEGLIALWQLGRWVIDQFHQFWDIIKSTIDSVHDFVLGNIQPAANTIEATLENLIPPAIDLIAKLLNIGNIPNKIGQVVDGVRGAVDRGIDKMVVGVMKRLGLGGKHGSHEPVSEKADESVYGSLLRKHPIEVGKEVHHLFVTGEPGRFDLVIASKVEPVDESDTVEANPEAEQAALRANDELAALNALAKKSPDPEAADPALARDVRETDEAVVILAQVLDGTAEALREPVTLATLKEPPSPEDRTAEQKARDLEDAQIVLGLAEKRVGDTAELAGYFDAIQRRFRLRKIEYTSLDGGRFGVHFQVNPKEDVLAGEPDLKGRIVDPSVPRLNPTVATKIWFESQSLSLRLPTSSGSFYDFEMDVGKNMWAEPLGPEHPLGSNTKNENNQGIYNFTKHLPTVGDDLPSEDRFVQAHLLPGRIGGPGTDPSNLFPTSDHANITLRSRVEDWVAQQIKLGYFVYYDCEIKDPDVVNDKERLKRAVNSRIEYTAGFWVLNSSNQFGRGNPQVHGALTSQVGAKPDGPQFAAEDLGGILVEEPHIEPASKGAAQEAKEAADKHATLAERFAGTANVISGLISREFLNREFHSAVGTARSHADEARKCANEAKSKREDKDGIEEARNARKVAGEKEECARADLEKMVSLLIEEARRIEPGGGLDRLLDAELSEKFQQNYLLVESRLDEVARVTLEKAFEQLDMLRDLLSRDQNGINAIAKSDLTESEEVLEIALARRHTLGEFKSAWKLLKAGEKLERLKESYGKFVLELATFKGVLLRLSNDGAVKRPIAQEVLGAIAHLTRSDSM
jgi:hypothetical protein